MKMEYKLLDNESGVILTRQPEIVEEELFISFIDAPADATAIFETNDGVSYYRALSEGTCSLPVKRVAGEVKVTVALLDGSARTRKWICEELLAKKQESGGTLVSPNDMNMPQRFVELKLENEGIRQNQERLEGRVKELEDRLEKLLEGYDLT